MSTAKNYCDEIKKNIGYYAAWPPNHYHKLGDFGKLDGNRFTYLGNIKDRRFRVKFTTRKHNAIVSFDHQTKGAVKITFQPKVSASIINASMKIEFSKKDAVLFKTSGNMETIGNIYSVLENITKLANKTIWKKEWVVISEILKADFTTALISKESGASIEFEAKSPQVTFLDLANLSADVKVKNSRHISTKVVATGRATPLFKLIGFKKKIPWGYSETAMPLTLLLLE